MSLDIQIGSLDAEKFNFKIYKNTHWKKYFLFPIYYLRRKLDFGSAELHPIRVSTTALRMGPFVEEVGRGALPAVPPPRRGGPLPLRG